MRFQEALETAQFTKKRIAARVGKLLQSAIDNAQPGEVGVIVMEGTLDIAAESSARAPKKMIGWLDALREAPTFAPYRGFGAMLSYGPEYGAVMRQVAEYLAKILRGARLVPSRLFSTII